MYVSSNSLEGALANAFGDNFLDDSCRPAWKTDAKTQSFPKRSNGVRSSSESFFKKAFWNRPLFLAKLLRHDNAETSDFFEWSPPTNIERFFFMAVHLAYILMFYLIFDVAYIQTFLCDIFSGIPSDTISDEQTDILSADIVTFYLTPIPTCYPKFYLTYAWIRILTLFFIWYSIERFNYMTGVLTYLYFCHSVRNLSCVLSRFWHSVWGADKISSWKCVGWAPRDTGSCGPRLRKGTNRVKAHQAGKAGIKPALISRDPRLVRNNMYFS